MTTTPHAPADATLHLKYRPDIDGLRAIAVLSVVGFHAFPQWVKGGFIGVDIFFVISGYLITTILLGNLSSHGFSYRDFYARRVRRLFPALLAVLAATFAFGWYALLVDEFGQLGKHIAAGAGFVSNLAFWSESGYFDTATESKPLLHLWSLAVEEQFYIVWPLLLGLAWRRHWNVLATLGAVAALSFLLNVAGVHPWASATFYLPASRFWELAAGGLLAYMRLHRPRLLSRGDDLQAIVGLVLIGAGLALLDKDKAFPGWWAILPVFGAFFCIAAGPAAWLNRRVLGSRLMVWFGLISYPLYLWHWPLLAYARVLEGGMPTRNVRIACVIAAVALAWATWKWVEQPLRHSRRTGVVRNLSIAMAVLFVLGLLAWAQRLPPRLSDPYLSRVAAATTDWAYPDGLAHTTLGKRPAYTIGTGPKRVLLFGDSHIEQYGPRAVEIARDGGPAALNTLLFATKGGCPPIPNVFEDRNVDCDAWRSDIIDYIHATRPDAVVIGGCWNCYFIKQAVANPDGNYDEGYYYRDRLAGDRKYAFRGGGGVEWAIKSLEYILKDLSLHTRVYFLLDNPIGDAFEPKHLITYDRLGAWSVQRVSPRVPLPGDQQFVDARLRELAVRSGATLIDPLPTLCPDGQCIRTTEDGTPVYKDSDHLRADYARERATYLDAVLKAAP